MCDSFNVWSENFKMVVFNHSNGSSPGHLRRAHWMASFRLVALVLFRFNTNALERKEDIEINCVQTAERPGSFCKGTWHRYQGNQESPKNSPWPKTEWCRESKKDWGVEKKNEGWRENGLWSWLADENIEQLTVNEKQLITLSNLSLIKVRWGWLHHFLHVSQLLKFLVYYTKEILNFYSMRICLFITHIIHIHLPY